MSGRSSHRIPTDRPTARPRSTCGSTPRSPISSASRTSRVALGGKHMEALKRVRWFTSSGNRDPLLLTGGRYVRHHPLAEPSPRVLQLHPPVPRGNAGSDRSAGDVQGDGRPVRLADDRDEATRVAPVREPALAQGIAHRMAPGDNWSPDARPDEGQERDD